MLTVAARVHAEMIGHAYGCLPEEACGLLAGDLRLGTATHFYPCRNAAESSRLYTVDPLDHLKADRDAEERGMEIVGVMHSHTHTAAYPSPTDVEQAPVPEWHYVIVSLADDAPVVRSFTIGDGQIEEERVALGDR